MFTELLEQHQGNFLVFTGRFCGYCTAAKRLLTQKQLPFVEISFDISAGMLRCQVGSSAYMLRCQIDMSGDVLRCKVDISTDVLRLQIDISGDVLRCQCDISTYKFG